ncbi:MAG: SPOR domain-containing protein [Cellvibrionales bacterium]|nr:SPOR domain-containing protein [Cellvibrionales bacterium]
MSRDFAKKTPPAKKKNKPARAKAKSTKTQLPWWIWFFSGVLLTLFGQFLLHLGASAPENTKGCQSSTPEFHWPKDKNNTKVQAGPIEKPDIKFYDTLKEQKVDVSAKPVQHRDEGSYDFSLQAGSFRQPQDAEQLRAELILLNLETQIQKTTSNSGSTWYRVIVGPFNSRAMFAKAKSTLLDNGIHPIRIKNR